MSKCFFSFERHNNTKDMVIFIIELTEKVGQPEEAIQIN